MFLGSGWPFLFLGWCVQYVFDYAIALYRVVETSYISTERCHLCLVNIVSHPDLQHIEPSLAAVCITSY